MEEAVLLVVAATVALLLVSVCYLSKLNGPTAALDSVLKINSFTQIHKIENRVFLFFFSTNSKRVAHLKNDRSHNVCLCLCCCCS